jgi:prefoldin subunit 5
VDPSHVYNRYHEYQKQIEAIEAELARLAVLKAERGAADAAAATLASAKAVSQTMSAACSQLENGRSHEVGANLETLNRPTRIPTIRRT